MIDFIPKREITDWRKGQEDEKDKRTNGGQNCQYVNTESQRDSIF